MISEISGKQFVLHERVLLVPDPQREAVESVLQRCGCRGEWSRTVSTVETYNDFDEVGGVSLWAMSLASKEDAKKVQAALDAIG